VPGAAGYSNGVPPTTSGIYLHRIAPADGNDAVVSMAIQDCGADKSDFHGRTIHRGRFRVG